MAGETKEAGRQGPRPQEALILGIALVPSPDVARNPARLFGSTTESVAQLSHTNDAARSQIRRVDIVDYVDWVAEDHRVLLLLLLQT